LALVGCSGFTDAIAPGRPGDEPARVSLSASVAQSIGTSGQSVSLEVISRYRRRDGSLVPLGQQVIALGPSSATVPVPVDVAACLADRDRDISAGDFVCTVQLQLTLVVGGAPVDAQVVGPLRLAPGVVTSVAEPVSLYEIASVEIGTEPGAPLVMGSSRSLVGIIRDSRGQAVSNRPIRWSSSDPSIASVTETGMVTGQAPGRATITATHGSVSGQAVVDVVRPPAALTVSAGAGSGRGTVRSVPEGIDCVIDGTSTTGSCSWTFAGDAVVTLTSTPAASNLFGQWGDACAAATGTSCQVTMSAPATARASFTALRLVSVASAGGDGKGRIVGTGSIDCAIDGTAATGNCEAEVPDGSSLTFTAVPQPGAGGAPTTQLFGGWSGACGGTVGTSCTVEVTGGNRALSARFFGEKRVSVGIEGAGGGTVTSRGTIACTRSSGATSGACSELVLHDATVSLTAVADARSVFDGWGGACAGSGAECVLAATADLSATARFRQGRTTLTLTLQGSGGGGLRIDDVDACTLEPGQASVTCATDVEIGRTIHLSARTNGTSVFVGFGGSCGGNGGCNLTIAGPTSVTATFATRLVPVTLALTGTGGGSVRIGTTEPCAKAVLQGPVECVRQLPAGALATITATPTPESSFNGFGSPCAAGAPTCTVLPDVPVRITATLTANPVPVTITALAGSNGDGVIESVGLTPQLRCTFSNGVASATGCATTVPFGTTFTLRAIADEKHLLAAWGAGCLSAATVECTLTATATTMASARFVEGIGATLTVSGAGRGTVDFTVSGVPTQAPCTLGAGATTVTCRYTIPIGGSGLFRATPLAPSSFGGFTGACSNAADPPPLMTCTFRGIGFSRDVSAVFN
jgi:hypothetical protein